MSPFEVRISAHGTLSDGARAELVGFDQLDDPSMVVLRGAVADQEALMGLLQRLRRAGLRIRDVERMPGSTPVSPPVQEAAVARLEVSGRVADLLRLAMVNVSGLEVVSGLEEASTTTIEIGLGEEGALFNVLADLEGLALDLHGLHVRPGNPQTEGPSVA
ncbi:MAG: hypothetical protein Q4P32_08325 [Micrococcales bacterium]|nr:hypothetical protein [Micrococcales bacterium]